MSASSGGRSPCILDMVEGVPYPHHLRRRGGKKEKEPGRVGLVVKLWPNPSGSYRPDSGMESGWGKRCPMDLPYLLNPAFSLGFPGPQTFPGVFRCPSGCSRASEIPSLPSERCSRMSQRIRWDPCLPNHPPDSRHTKNDAGRERARPASQVRLVAGARSVGYLRVIIQRAGCPFRRLRGR